MLPTLLPHQSRRVDASSFLDPTSLHDGDVLLTYGTGGIWPPRRWLLWIVYHAIHKFQQRRWGENSDTRATHVRVWLNGRFFEATTPRCRWTNIDDLQLDRKHWRIARYIGPISHIGPIKTLNRAAMLQSAYRLIHTPYDKGDLLDFALSGWLGRAANTISLFGDRANKYRVCSTAAAEVLQAGGAQFQLPPSQVDPAYFVNVSEDWRLVATSIDQ
jgi:hypothetical protein